MNTKNSESDEQKTEPSSQAKAWIKKPVQFLFLSIPKSLFGWSQIKNNNQYIADLFASIKEKPTRKGGLPVKGEEPARVRLRPEQIRKALNISSILVFFVFTFNLFFLVQGFVHHFSSGNWIVLLAFAVFLAVLFLVLRYLHYLLDTDEKPLGIGEWVISFFLRGNK